MAAEAPDPTRVVKAAGGIKKFVMNRLKRLSEVLTRDNPGKDSEPVYLTETEDKHPDSWEEKEDGRWIRHHNVARRDPFTPVNCPGGPVVEDLTETESRKGNFQMGQSIDSRIVGKRMCS